MRYNSASLTYFIPDMPIKQVSESKPTIVKLPFDEVAKYIQGEIRKRRSNWRSTNVMEWEDVAQELLIRAYNKYPLFDPNKAPLQHWLNTLISNAIKNLMRDKVYRSSRPCLGNGKDPHKCAFNAGGNLCSWEHNLSGVQCSACPTYKAWTEKKANMHNIVSPVSIENHSQEINNIQSDFLDIAAKKEIIDAKIIAALDSQHEVKLYTLLFIEHKSPEEVGNTLRYKQSKNNRAPGYQVILKFQKKVYKLARYIVNNEDIM